MIDSRFLGVYFRGTGADEGLQYNRPPEHVGEDENLRTKDAHERAIRDLIEALRNKVNRLIALGEGARGEMSVQPEAEALSQYVLPEDGLFGLMGYNHPHFQTLLDVAAEIPWEALQEACLICRNNHRRNVPQGWDSDFAPPCPECREPMRQTVRRHVDDYHLSHCLGPGKKAITGGNRFLLVIDPKEDLLKKGTTRPQHCAAITTLVNAAGFTEQVLQGPNATRSMVKAAIEDPQTAGIYFYGHGYFDTKRGGSLHLADGDLLADEIKSGVRFVFLNACWAGLGGGEYDTLQRRVRSVAQAFACGAGRVVIAPIFPVLNLHAAEAACQFFRAAQADCVGDALRKVREWSWREYDTNNKPNICWLAYRLYGDPNSNLILRAAAPSDRPLPEADDLFDPEVFSFDIAAVLRDAFERCRHQDRTRITPLDFLAGMMRQNSLCRSVFEQEGADVETLWNALLQRREGEPIPLRRDAPVEGVPASRAFFREELDHLLRRVEQQAGSELISDQLVLETLAEGGKWAVSSDPSLPKADRVLDRLRGGVVSLDDLDFAARNVIEMAHALTRQRGLKEIPNRLMLASLLSSETAFGTSVCRVVHVDPEMLCKLMIALAGDEETGGSAHSLALTPEACRRVVTPMLNQARKLASGRTVTERDVFRAFCTVAHEGFKEILKSMSEEAGAKELGLSCVDLDELAFIDPEWEAKLDPIDDSARGILHEAHKLSQNCGSLPIPNRLLLAAFLGERAIVLPPLLRRKRISPDTLQAQLIAYADTGTPRQVPLDEQVCGRAVRPMLDQARQLAAGGPITEGILFRGFCATTPAELKRLLRAPSFQVDLDLLAEEAQHPPAETIDPPLPPAIDTDWDPHPFRAEQFDQGAWKVLGGAARLAREQGWPEIRSPHLMGALFANADGEAARMMRGYAIDPNEFAKIALSLLGVAPPPQRTDAAVRMGTHVQQIVAGALQQAGQQGHTTASVDDLFMAMYAETGGHMSNLLRHVTARAPAGAIGLVPGAARRGSALAEFGVDLTDRARKGELPEIVGRDDEINTALQTLLLLENANPLLVGEAGVGKTAIVEGIARRIALGPCPKKLESMKVIELSAGSLVANTRLRGEFEQRIQEVLAEAREGVVLFIDEIHSIVGAGSAEGGGPDAGNMLKTALAKGEVRLIGATTNAEFRRTIARDRALSRRFQVQNVGPPSREATLRILAARQAALEKHHEVRVSEEARIAAVDLSGRHIVDKQWPAKARDVLERACVLAVTESEPPADGTLMTITGEHVAKVVSGWIGVPLERLSADEFQRLTELEKRLSARIVGQSEAIHLVSDAIRRGRQSIAGRNRPLGVFLFAGPPGVGKTELAKVIGEEVFGGSEGLIRFDMADFSEPHSAARLIGAPPGYIGYQQGAPLVERLRAHPYSLLLFDEIEHAHESTLAVLLRLLSEGTVVDQDGNMADGRNAIVVFTSNILVPGADRKALGFADLSAGSNQADLRTLLERRLPRKLIDRIDAIVRFAPLANGDLRELVCREVTDRAARLAAFRGIEITVAEGVVDWLLTRVAEVGQGARAVARTVDRFDTAVAERFGGGMGEQRRLIVSVTPDGTGIIAEWADSESPEAHAAASVDGCA